MAAVDSYIPQPSAPMDKPFLMPIEDVFSISGRGTVVHRPRRARHRQGRRGSRDRRHPATPRRRSCTGVEMFRKLLDQGRGRRQRRRSAARHRARGGRARPGAVPSPARSSRTPKFKAEVYVLTKEEGGRHTPFFTNYRPQFYFRTTDVTGIGRSCRRAPRWSCPATTSRIDVELIAPIAMDEGLRFAIREGGRTVGCRRRRENHRVVLEIFDEYERRRRETGALSPCAVALLRSALLWSVWKEIDEPLFSTP